MLTGKDIAVLNCKKGHLALLVQNEEREWVYYSLNGTLTFISTHGSLEGAPHHNLGEQSFDSCEEFLYSNYNTDGEIGLINQDEINGYGYNEASIIQTTETEDKEILNSFKKSVKQGYNLLWNNCVDAVQDALNSVGIEAGNKFLPKNAFNYIIKNNNGRRVSK